MATTKLEARITQMETDFSQRISELEAEVLRLKQEHATVPEEKKPWWEEIRGTFKDAPAYKEAMQYGREYRLAQRGSMQDMIIAIAPTLMPRKIGLSNGKQSGRMG